MKEIVVRPLVRADYLSIWHQMKEFTVQRTPETPDEIWLIEHPAVYTLGQAGKPEHILNPGTISIVNSDRGGQVTYHGLGQLLIYPLIDLSRRRIGVKTLVKALENSVIGFLKDYGVVAHTRLDAPGVYVDQAKIASIGLRIKRGCSYHGMAFNINMDLLPFKGINPCGFRDLAMCQLEDFVQGVPLTQVANHIIPLFVNELRRIPERDNPL